MFQQALTQSGHIGSLYKLALGSEEVEEQNENLKKKTTSK
jgi:hypothetical protein